MLLLSVVLYYDMPSLQLLQLKQRRNIKLMSFCWSKDFLAEMWFSKDFSKTEWKLLCCENKFCAMKCCVQQINLHKIVCRIAYRHVTRTSTDIKILTIFGKLAWKKMDYSLFSLFTIINLIFVCYQWFLNRVAYHSFTWKVIILL